METELFGLLGFRQQLLSLQRNRLRNGGGDDSQGAPSSAADGAPVAFPMTLQCIRQQRNIYFWLSRICMLIQNFAVFIHLKLPFFIIFGCVILI